MLSNSCLFLSSLWVFGVKDGISKSLGQINCLELPKASFTWQKLSLQPSQSSCCNGCVEGIWMSFWQQNFYFGSHWTCWPSLWDKARDFESFWWVQEVTFAYVVLREWILIQPLSSIQQHTNSDFTHLNRARNNNNKIYIIQHWGRTMASLSLFLGSELGNEVWYHLYSCH